MTFAQKKLARRRLWLGITDVGFRVLAASTGLAWPARIGPNDLVLETRVLMGAGAFTIQSVLIFSVAIG
jgi:hypothetical protein